jgi:hypothetical protein
MSLLFSIALGAATAGGSTASMMYLGGDVARWAIWPGFLAVWFAPPLSEEADYAVFYGVNTSVWAVAWQCCPELTSKAAAVIMLDAAIRLGESGRKRDGPP